MSEKQLKEFREALDRVQKEIGKSPEKARQLLEGAGIYTADGRLAEPYRTEQ